MLLFEIQKGLFPDKYRLTPKLICRINLDLTDSAVILENGGSGGGQPRACINVPILADSVSLRENSMLEPTMYPIRAAGKCFVLELPFPLEVWQLDNPWKKSYCLITGFPPFTDLWCRGREPN